MRQPTTEERQFAALPESIQSRTLALLASALEPRQEDRHKARQAISVLAALPSAPESARVLLRQLSGLLEAIPMEA